MRKIKKILLVDDSQTSNILHARLIERINSKIEVDVTTNGRMAIKHLTKSKNPPDLIILDVNMPIMNGLEFLEEYEELNEKLKARKLLVMITESTKAKDIKSVRGFGYAKSRIHKPLTEENLAVALDKEKASEDKLTL